MRNERVLEMTTLAVFITIIALMALVPFLGFVQIGPVSATIIHIPVIIGALYGGKRMGIALGIAFGLSSWFVSLWRAATPFDLMFQNPLLSVVPRVLFGLAIWYVFLMAKNIIKNKTAAIATTFVVSTLIHTILVMGTAMALAPFYEDVIGAELFEFILTVLPLIAGMEMAIAALAGTPIVLALLKAESVAGFDLFDEERKKEIKEDMDDDESPKDKK